MPRAGERRSSEEVGEVAVLESPAIDDDGAFEQLCRDHGAALLALCRRRLGDAGRADAEDACQETLLRAYRALPTFDRGRPLWPWLATIAANVCTDMHRRRRTEPLGAHELAQRQDPVDVDELVAGRMRARFVDDAIGELPGRYRRQVWLADVAGWSYADIADHERTSVASVRSSLVRGRRALRSRMRQLGDEGRLWPLPSLLPLGRLRRRAHDVGTHTSAVAPCLPTLAQAAAAAIAIVAVATPASTAVTGGASASWHGDRVPARVVAVSAERLAEHRPATGGAGPVERDLLVDVGPQVEAASEIDTTGPWRLVSARVAGDAAGQTVDVGVSVELSCHEQGRLQSACETSEGMLGPDDPD